METKRRGFIKGLLAVVAGAAVSESIAVEPAANLLSEEALKNISSGFGMAAVKKEGSVVKYDDWSDATPYFSGDIIKCKWDGSVWRTE